MKPTQTIIMTSNEPWGDVWFSKHHYANELAKLGYRVYFLNAPGQWQLKHLVSFSVTTHGISENLTIVTYHNNFPVRFWKRFFVGLNDWLNCLKLFWALDRSEGHGIWWQFDPFRFINILHFRGYKRIYHVVDPYQHVWSDALIAQRADLVVITSQTYAKFYQNLMTPPLYIPHGISQNELEQDADRMKGIEKKIGKNYIVFAGTINKDVDINLLLEASAALSGQKFVLIGPVKSNIGEGATEQFRQLCRQANVIYLGEQKASELKEYIALAAVGIVPYVQAKIPGISRTPLKILNYIAQDKPVVTTINFDLTSLVDNVIFGVRSHDQFIDTLDRILNGKLSVDTQQLSAYRSSIFYPNLIQKILPRLDAKENAEICAQK